MKLESQRTRIKDSKVTNKVLNYLWPMSLTSPDTRSYQTSNKCFHCNFAKLYFHQRCVSGKSLISFSLSHSSSSCGFSSPTHLLPCSSLNSPLKGEMEGAGEWCRRGEVPLCHIYRDLPAYLLSQSLTHTAVSLHSCMFLTHSSHPSSRSYSSCLTPLCMHSVFFPFRPWHLKDGLYFP